MKLRVALVLIVLAFAACKKKSGDVCSERRLAAAATIELAQNELAKQERAVDAAIVATGHDNKDSLAVAARLERLKARIAKRRDLLVQWGGALAGATAIAIDPNAGGGAGSSTTTGADNLDDAPPSFVAARTMVIEFVAACTRS
jgi:hypothetical protein